MVKQNQKELSEKLQGEKFVDFLKCMTEMLDKNGNDFMVGKGVSSYYIPYFLQHEANLLFYKKFRP